MRIKGIMLYALCSMRTRVINFWEKNFMGLKACRFTTLATVVFLLSCVRMVPTPALSSEVIRVAILKDVSGLKAGGVDRIEGGRVGNGIDGKELTITAEGERWLAINGEMFGLSLKLSSSSGVVYINGRPFRGEVEVIAGSKGLLVVNEIDLETYLVGLINHEISSRWPMEAIKAQAVVARTYALYQKRKRGGALYHLEGTVTHQVYSGSITEDVESLTAIQATWGEVLFYGGELALTVYHSNGGGQTEASGDVWGKDYPYLRGVESPYDKDSPTFLWGFEIDRALFVKALRDAGYPLEDIKGLIVMERTRSGRVKRLRVVSTNMRLDITGEELRRVLGYDKIKSTIFTFEDSMDSFHFSGRGSGHGVGLSQWGAKGMAEKGYDYREILLHYYPGARLVKLY